MSNEEYKKNIAAICEHYGYNSQSRQLIEEMAELTVAINKWWRCDGDLRQRAEKRANIVEEIADVKIMLDQMIYFICGKAEVEKIVNAKIERQLNRMESEEK